MKIICSPHGVSLDALMFFRSLPISDGLVQAPVGHCEDENCIALMRVLESTLATLRASQNSPMDIRSDASPSVGSAGSRSASAASSSAAGVGAASGTAGSLPASVRPEMKSHESKQQSPEAGDPAASLLAALKSGTKLRSCRC